MIVPGLASVESRIFLFDVLNDEDHLDCVGVDGLRFGQVALHQSHSLICLQWI